LTEKKVKKMNKKKEPNPEEVPPVDEYEDRL